MHTIIPKDTITFEVAPDVCIHIVEMRTHEINRHYGPQIRCRFCCRSDGRRSLYLACACLLGGLGRHQTRSLTGAG